MKSWIGIRTKVMRIASLLNSDLTPNCLPEKFRRGYENLRLVYKKPFFEILRGCLQLFDRVNSDTWFQRVDTTELIGWKRWDSPRRNQIPDPARGDYHNRSRTPLQRPYLGR